MSDQRPPDVRRVIAETRRSYDATAVEYAQSTADYAAYPALRDAVLEFEKAVPQGRPILDLGCGGGRDSRLLAGLRRDVVAGDISVAMLRCVGAAPGGETPAPVRLDMLALPFADAAFGGVWACASLLHLPSAAFGAALSEIARTLAPGATAAVSMRAGDHEGWRESGTLPARRWFTLVDPLGFAATMAGAGFTGVDIAFTGREHWFIATGRR